MEKVKHIRNHTTNKHTHTPNTNRKDNRKILNFISHLPDVREWIFPYAVPKCSSFKRDFLWVWMWSFCCCWLTKFGLHRARFWVIIILVLYTLHSYIAIAAINTSVRWQNSGEQISTVVWSQSCRVSVSGQLATQDSIVLWCRWIVTIFCFKRVSKGQKGSGRKGWKNVFPGTMGLKWCPS